MIVEGLIRRWYEARRRVGLGIHVYEKSSISHSSSAADSLTYLVS